MSLEIIIAILFIPFFLFLGHWYRNRNSLVTNWPIVRMMPALLCNSGQVFEFFTDLVNFYGGTFKFKGPWFPSLDIRSHECTTFCAETSITMKRVRSSEKFLNLLEKELSLLIHIDGEAKGRFCIH
ncbi:hypothetical protein QQP08_005946 [Theobroma cacao]|nr:hypothetical protein QQP08_005946 [Theobroma cacao]